MLPLYLNLLNIKASEMAKQSQKTALNDNLSKNNVRQKE
jgi:hypothetical protein